MSAYDEEDMLSSQCISEHNPLPLNQLQLEDFVTRELGLGNGFLVGLWGGVTNGVLKRRRTRVCEGDANLLIGLRAGLRLPFPNGDEHIVVVCVVADLISLLSDVFASILLIVLA